MKEALGQVATLTVRVQELEIQYELCTKGFNPSESLSDGRMSKVGMEKRIEELSKLVNAAEEVATEATRSLRDYSKVQHGFYEGWAFGFKQGTQNSFVLPNPFSELHI